VLFRLAACCLTVATVASISGVAQDAAFVPARLLGGSLPLTPSPNVVARIEETLQIMVDVTGGVAQMTPLRASPLPNDLLMPAVGGWRFQPAMDQGRVVPSRVLVAAIFRPPQLDNSPTLGNPPVDLAAASDEIPLPIVTQTPVYPPIATGEGVVLVEVLVGSDGRGLTTGRRCARGPRGTCRGEAGETRRRSATGQSGRGAEARAAR